MSKLVVKKKKSILNEKKTNWIKKINNKKLNFILQRGLLQQEKLSYIVTAGASFAIYNA